MVDGIKRSRVILKHRTLSSMSVASIQAMCLELDPLALHHRILKKYTFRTLREHNFRSINPTFIKVYIF